MASMPLSPSLVDLFRSTTSSSSSSSPPSLRVILVQTSAPSSTGGKPSLEATRDLPACGSDREDLSPLLTQLFASEPDRSGYALFRLDSQAANGDWEWLLIAYQPERAKVKEKMQYNLTRTSLTAGLGDAHFLETMYATAPADFRFPDKLRNARKHDYQNPQLKTAGKPASEAAGTDAGGARRFFGQAAAPKQQSSSSSSSSSSVGACASASASASAGAAGKTSPTAGKAAVEDLDATSKSSGAPLEALAQKAVQPTAAAAAADGEKPTPSEQTQPRAQAKDAEEEADTSIAPSAQPNLPPTDTDAGGETALADQAKAEADRQLGSGSGHGGNASQEPLATTTSLARQAQPLSDEAAEQAIEESKAPEEPPTPAVLATPREEAREVLSTPLVPDAETARRQLDDDEVPVAAPQSEGAEGAAPVSAKSAAAPVSEPQSEPAAASAKPAASAPPSSSSADGGASSGSNDSSSGSTAPPRKPFTSAKAIEWAAEAEAAVSGLSSRLSGSSEHNFVSLTVSPSTDGSSPHQVQLTSPPRFVVPGDLSSSLEAEMTTVDANGSHIPYIFYRYPSEVETRKVAYMYTEVPARASPQLKTLYGNSLASMQSKAASLSGVEVQREALTAQYGPYPRPTPEQAEEVSSRIESIKYQVAAASRDAGRIAAPRLVAVSKLHPPSSILAAYVHTAQRHFGENYVQEMVDKAKVLPRDIAWHFVGGLQSNKAKALAAVPNLFLLETLDSIKAANGLEKALSAADAPKRDGPLRVYLQVNTSGEEAKSGLPPLTQADVEAGADSPLVDLAKHVMAHCPHLRFLGLMTIGSAANSTGAGEAEGAGAASSSSSRERALRANPDFARLYESRRNLVVALRRAFASASGEAPEGYSAVLNEGEGGSGEGSGEGEDGATGGLELSMGMTNDFPVAIAAGSDNVRIGTACFGARPGSRDEARRGMEAELATATATAGAGAGAGEQGGAGAGAQGGAPPSLGDKGFAKPRPQGRRGGGAARGAAGAE